MALSFWSILEFAIGLKLTLPRGKGRWGSQEDEGTCRVDVLRARDALGGCSPSARTIRAAMVGPGPQGTSGIRGRDGSDGGC
eukprot:2696532-Pyramimonas_sp.AAC.2